MSQGQYNQNNVYASVPAILGKNGVEEIIELDMTEDEKKQFNESCELMHKNYLMAINM